MAAGKVTGSVNQFVELDDIIQINFHTLIRNAMPKMMTDQTNKWFRGMAEVLNSQVGTKTAFTTAHHRLAADMQQAVLNSYDERVEANKEFASYRIGENRLSGGILRKVLSESDQFVAFNDGISFGNKPRLNEAAAHWARLNFGANPAGDLYPQGRFTLHFGKRLAELQIPGFKSPAFKMPKGVWDTRGTRSRQPGFYPTGSKLVKQTGGIEGTHYFDAALAHLTSPDGLEAVYDDLLYQFVARAKREGTGPLAGRGYNIKDFYS